MRTAGPRRTVRSLETPDLPRCRRMLNLKVKYRESLPPIRAVNLSEEALTGSSATWIAPTCCSWRT